MTIEISILALQAYRNNTYRLKPGTHLASVDDALSFVNERGFIYFWPIKGVDLPSLWVAAAGNRPVADGHDDPGHITWSWKDSMLGKRRWYYAHLLRRRSTIVSLDIIPNFYALSPNYGDPETDYLDQYQQGLMTLECKNIYEALLREGPLNTLDLRKAARLSSSEGSSRFNKALDDLQIELKVVPMGVAEVGAWHYSFIYDLTSRHFPMLVEQAGKITENKARQNLILSYLRSVGMCQENHITRLFGWKKPEYQKALDELISSKQILPDVKLELKKGDWFSMPEIAPE